MDIYEYIERLHRISEGLDAMSSVFEDDGKSTVCAKLYKYSNDIDLLAGALKEELNKRENAHESND